MGLGGRSKAIRGKRGNQHKLPRTPMGCRYRERENSAVSCHGGGEELEERELLLSAEEKKRNRVSSEFSRAWHSPSSEAHRKCHVRPLLA
jgi:hypothetical protein